MLFEKLLLSPVAMKELTNPVLRCRHLVVVGVGGEGGERGRWGEGAGCFAFLWFVVCICILPGMALRKHAYSNILKILPPKNENFQIKNSDNYHISAQNIDCWYSLEPPRRFLYVFEQK